MLIRYRAHYASHCQTVKIIVNKDQDTQKDGGKLGSRTACNVFARPSPERRRTSRLVHQADHDPKNYQKYQNTHIVAVGQHSYDTILKYMCNRSLKSKP